MTVYVLGRRNRVNPGIQAFDGLTKRRAQRVETILLRDAEVREHILLRAYCCSTQLQIRARRIERAGIGQRPDSYVAAAVAGDVRTSEVRGPAISQHQSPHRCSVRSRDTARQPAAGQGSR